MKHAILLIGLFALSILLIGCGSAPDQQDDAFGKQLGDASKTHPLSSNPGARKGGGTKMDTSKPGAQGGQKGVGRAPGAG